MLFHTTLDIITRRVGDYEKEQSRKGNSVERFSQLQTKVIEEKKRIENLNDLIDHQEKKIKEIQFQYKEQVKLELGEINEQKQVES